EPTKPFYKTPPTQPASSTSMISMTVANSVTTSTPLVDAIAEVETNGAEPTHIIAAPDTWTAIRKLKAGDASNQPLVNQDVATETQRQVEGLPVIVNRHAEPGSLLIIDRSEIISSVSQIELATTKDAYFTDDAVEIRVAFRFGFGVIRGERIAKLTLNSAEEEA